MLYIVFVNYQDRDAVERVRPSHLEWIRRHTAEGAMLFTGRRTSPESGVMIGQALDIDQFRAILAEDPYAQTGAATHDVIEFDPRGGCLLPAIRSYSEVG